MQSHCGDRREERRESVVTELDTGEILTNLMPLDNQFLPDFSITSTRGTTCGDVALGGPRFYNTMRL